MTFRKELETVINRYSQENGSNTPDFILADYLTNCLLAFDSAVNARERWYGRKPGWRKEIPPAETTWPTNDRSSYKGEAGETPPAT